jgi:hippurate hydrolase
VWQRTEGQAVCSQLYEGPESVQLISISALYNALGHNKGSIRMINPERASDFPAEWIAEAVAWRRRLHQHPELAFHEQKTADFIAAQLVDFGLSVHRGLGGTGVVGTLSRGIGQRTIGIRADMDALPIEEKSGVPYASSVKGVMHACGHDGHVAMLLAAARACAKLSGLAGTVHFIFQPAEETANCSGAKRMVEDGLFRRFPCDAIYALHNWPALPLGACVVRDGAMLAAHGVFEIVVNGRGCHGALPHEGTDTILASCQLVSTLQSITSRNVDPRKAAVVSVSQIHAGDTWNTIPDSCVIRGTTRWFDEGAGDILERRLTELSNAIASGFGCIAQIRYERRIPATINEREAARTIRAVASDPSINLKIVDYDPSTGSEDFAFMQQVVPGCYLLLGTGKSSDSPTLHSPQYDFNDDALSVGATLWVSLVKRSLAVA